MTRITEDALYRLLPAVHRLRDADEGEPLRALIGVLAREGAVIEEDIEQLLDNLFIETCADWAAPYIGGTIGYRTLHSIEGLPAATRAEVANTIAYRRRKGTPAVLEQLARDVTGWPARVVEYFQLVATCQHMNHIRPRHFLAPDLRDPLDLEPLGEAFDAVTRAVDVRAITQSPGRRSIGGRHNLPNIGLHLWRLEPFAHTAAPTTQVDARRYLSDPLGAPRRLMNRQQPEASITSLAQPVHVPGFLTRRMLDADPALWYGPGRAFEILLDGVPVPVEAIEACDLSDDGAGWNHSPHTATDPVANALVRVDPELGRIAFPDPEAREVRTTFHLGFPGQIGGGEYNRAASLALLPGQTPVQFPDPGFPTLQAAIDSLPAEGGVIEITTGDVIPGPLAIDAADAAEIDLRAADGVRPILRLAASLALSGGTDARITLNGLTIEGAPVQIAPDGDGVSLKEVTLRHVTLIPGLGFDAAGAPRTPGATSLDVSTTGLELFLDRCVTGPIRMTDTTNAEIRDSIVDAAAADSIDSAEGTAIAGPGADDPAGALTILGSTVIGRIHARSFPLVSDSILLARDPLGPPVRAMRRQVGCMRFSFVPRGSVTPRRYRCQPQLAIDQAIEARQAELGGPVPQAERDLIALRIVRRMVPSFTALSASHPAYAQLRRSAPEEIRRGASDEGEMGAWHLLFQPQREANLRIRLEEYLRFGLEAGLFFET
jgi:hypothetical protein